MQALIPIGLVYNDIIAVAICQLMVFLIDLSQAYLSMLAVITPVAKSCGARPLIFLFSSHNCSIFLTPEFTFYMADLTGFGQGASSVSPSFPPCLKEEYACVLMYAARLRLCGHMC